MKLILSTESGASIGATVIGSFERQDDAEPTAAPTFRNMALTIFDAVPEATKVVLVRVDTGRLLFIVWAAGRWYDGQANAIGVAAAERKAVA